MSSVAEYLEEYDQKQVEEISIEYGRLMDWFEKEYPEATIRLDVDADRRVGAITYKLSVLTGKEMANNQGFFESKVVITADRFRDMYWMERFKKSLYEGYKREISQRINEHYWTEKEKNN